MTKKKKLVARNVTKINVPCGFNGQVSEVSIFVGDPENKHHPIHFQAKFIQEVKGGMVPPAIMESLEKLQKLSVENGVPFQELCQYALNSINDNKALNDESSAPPPKPTDDILDEQPQNGDISNQVENKNIDTNNSESSAPPPQPTDDIVDAQLQSGDMSNQVENENIDTNNSELSATTPQPTDDIVDEQPQDGDMSGKKDENSSGSTTNTN
jgi:hypothetical protein